MSPKARRSRIRQKQQKNWDISPTITARRLKKQRTDTLGFIMPTFGPRFSDPFFSEFIAGVGNKAAEA
jgi:DNA-binding LacI/PurR family transcriptional regulator